jgi:hypothetical protein
LGRRENDNYSVLRKEKRDGDFYDSRIKHLENKRRVRKDVYEIW